jgi:RHS repeat-associated protein
VVHAGGTTVVTANQRSNGGSWKYLGSFSFSPNAGHKVVLQAAADGDAIADAIRLVGSVPAPANVAYIHADHLGTPQKMTDASKAITWDRVQDPFGNTVSLAGAAQVPARFPGQYADEESALAYNYFRDYDPTLGRYLQSDPIGLAGGLNTYGYVGGNPLRWVDPTGEYANGVVIGLVGTAVVGVALAIQCYNYPIIGGSSGGGLRSPGEIIGAIGGSIADSLPSWLASDSASGGDSAAGEGGSTADGKGGAKTPEDLIGESTEGRDTKGRAEQYIHPGGREQRDKDFESMRPTNVIDRGNGTKTGTLPDGRPVNIHDSPAGPTIEIDNGNSQTKIRYPEGL